MFLTQCSFEPQKSCVSMLSAVWRVQGKPLKRAQKGQPCTFIVMWTSQYLQLVHLIGQ